MSRSRTRALLLVLSLPMFLIAEPALAAPDPKLGKTALVNAVSGTVKVKERAESDFEKLSKSPQLIDMGSIINATRGKVRVRTAGDDRGLDEGTFWKGAFELSQNRREGATEAVLRGEIGGGGCAVRAGGSRGSAEVPRLWVSSSDPFRTVGSFSGAEAKKDDTRWMTEDLCNGTRTVVKRGTVQTYDGPVIILNVDAGASVQHFCGGVEPVSRDFCTTVNVVPHLGIYATGIVNLGDATSYDLCVTNPAGEERCETYPFSEPFSSAGHRISRVVCSTDSGPGTYSLRWLIDGVQLGPALGVTSDRPPGQDCVHRP